MSRVGVVTIAHGRHEHLHHQHRSLARSQQLPDYVVVAMDDADLEHQTPQTVEGLTRTVVHVGAGPDGLPLAAARNRGVAELARRGADVAILLDVDCLAAPELVPAYAGWARRRPCTVWSGPVTYLPPAPPDGWDLDRLADLDAPHAGRPAPEPGQVLDNPVPDLFWSLSFAVDVRLWREVEGMDEGFVGYGAEDTDFARRVVRHGFHHAFTGSARAYHQHHPTADPPVEHVDDLLRNGRRFAERWGEWPYPAWLERLGDAGLIERARDGWRRR